MTLVPLNVTVETKTEEVLPYANPTKLKAVEREATVRVLDTKRNTIYTYELHGVSGQITTEVPSEFDRLFAEEMVAVLERDRVRRQEAA